MSVEWKAGDRAIVRSKGTSLDGKVVILLRQIPCFPGEWLCKPADSSEGYTISMTPERFSRLDPRESAPVAMKAPRPHDGQANTSGVDREPLGRGLASAILDAYREQTTPSMLTVLEGIHRWQQADPRHRHVRITLAVHTVVVSVRLMDGSADRVIKFVLPFPADDVIGFLDGLIAVPPHEPVTMGNIESREDR